MSDEKGFLIADEDQVDRLLDRMAEELLAVTDSVPHLLGIRRRGVPLMERIGERMEERTGSRLTSDELALKRYADDLSVLHDQPELQEEPDLNVRDRTVVLVDDVLFSGRTMWRAINLVQDAGADRVLAAVLCSRGANDVPVQTASVGFQLDVCEGNVIEVHIPPYEDDTGVWLFHRADLSEA